MLPESVLMLTSRREMLSKTCCQSRCTHGVPTPSANRTESDIGRLVGSRAGAVSVGFRWLWVPFREHRLCPACREPVSRSPQGLRRTVVFSRLSPVALRYKKDPELSSTSGLLSGGADGTRTALLANRNTRCFAGLHRFEMLRVKVHPVRFRRRT
jgi:hypothetical protein